MMISQARSTLQASIAVGGAGAVWGCFWLPARYFDGRGVQDGLFSTALFSVTVIFMLPWLVLRWRQWRKEARPLAHIGIWTGIAFALYANALVNTEVVRALLLFYLTPVWSTVLGIAMLGERLTIRRVIAVIVGVSGGLVILGLDLGFPLPRNLGDWMSLIAGMCWALASVHIARAPDVSISGQTFAYSLGSLALSALLMAWLTPAGTSVSLPTIDGELVAALVGFALLINLPCMTALIWGAGQLSPGRVGILLCMELVFGVASAAVLAGEPFGLREGLGTALILGAVLIEVLKPPTPGLQAPGTATP